MTIKICSKGIKRLKERKKFSKKKDRKEKAKLLNSDDAIWQNNISRTVNVQTLSEIFTIKGLTYQVCASLLRQTRAAFKILPNLGLFINKADTNIKMSKCAAYKKKIESCRIRPGMRGPWGIKMQITKQIESFNIQETFFC